MKAVNAIIILVITLSCPAFAQLEFSGLKLRKTVFDNSKDAEKPANFTMTFPKDKDEFFAANIAIGLGWENDQTLITPMFEWHYNNLIDKEQDNIKAGLNLYQLMSGWGLNGAATLNNDRQKNEEKAQLLVTVFPVIK